jgi:hypothetical protein
MPEYFIYIIDMCLDVSGDSMTLSRRDWKSTVSTIFPQIHGAEAAALPGGVFSSFLLRYKSEVVSFKGAPLVFMFPSRRIHRNHQHLTQPNLRLSFQILNRIRPVVKIRGLCWRVWRTLEGSFSKNLHG